MIGFKQIEFFDHTSIHWRPPGCPYTLKAGPMWWACTRRSARQAPELKSSCRPSRLYKLLYWDTRGSFRRWMTSANGSEKQEVAAPSGCPPDKAWTERCRPQA